MNYKNLTLVVLMRTWLMKSFVSEPGDVLLSGNKVLEKTAYRLYKPCRT